jgi:toxin ParE1/3/4
MPNLGKSYQINNPKLKGLRQWKIKGFQQYIIFYLVSEEFLKIVRIIYATRDIATILEKQ